MLQKGDQIALIAPSGWFSKDDLDFSLKWFENQGLKPIIMPHAYDLDLYAAGTPQNRADDINSAFANQNIKALFCIRGGAGSLKTLDYLDYNIIKNNPKPIFGLSDSTALQNAVYTKTGNISYTGFLPIYDFKDSVLDKTIEQSMLHIFQNKPFLYEQFEPLRKGSVQGVLVGGCLSVFLSLCGSQYFPSLKNKIILIEDVGEKTYRLDLMLEQLKMQKDFNSVQGFIFGKFNKCEMADIGDGTVDEIIKRFVRDVDKPAVFNFPYGHIKTRVLMPIGQEIKIETDRAITPIVL